MSGIKWSAFSAGSALTTGDQFVGLQSGVNVRWTMSQLQTFMASHLTMDAGTQAAPSLAKTGAADTGLFYNAANLAFSSGNFSVWHSNAGMVVYSGGRFGWTDGQAVGGTVDLALGRDGAGILAQRNGANAQTLRVYNTFTDASNYERVNIVSDGSFFYFQAGNAGTGNPQGIAIQTAAASNELRLNQAGSTIWKLQASGGHFLAGTDATYDIGASGANRPRTLYLAGGGTAAPEMNLAVSAAPTSPHDGDIWREDNTNTGLKIRVNGVTKTITLS